MCFEAGQEKLHFGFYTQVPDRIQVKLQPNPQAGLLVLHEASRLYQPRPREAADTCWLPFRIFGGLFPSPVLQVVFARPEFQLSTPFSTLIKNKLKISSYSFTQS